MAGRCFPTTTYTGNGIFVFLLMGPIIMWKKKCFLFTTGCIYLQRGTLNGQRHTLTGSKTPSCDSLISGAVLPPARRVCNIEVLSGSFSHFCVVPLDRRVLRLVSLAKANSVLGLRVHFTLNLREKCSLGPRSCGGENAYFWVVDIQQPCPQSLPTHWRQDPRWVARQGHPVRSQQRQGPEPRVAECSW